MRGELVPAWTNRDSGELLQLNYRLIDRLLSQALVNLNSYIIKLKCLSAYFVVNSFSNTIHIVRMKRANWWKTRLLLAEECSPDDSCSRKFPYEALLQSVSVLSQPEQRIESNASVGRACLWLRWLISKVIVMLIKVSLLDDWDNWELNAPYISVLLLSNNLRLYETRVILLL